MTFYGMLNGLLVCSYASSVLKLFSYRHPETVAPANFRPMHIGMWVSSFFSFNLKKKYIYIEQICVQFVTVVRFRSNKLYQKFRENRFSDDIVMIIKTMFYLFFFQFICKLSTHGFQLSEALSMFDLDFRVLLCPWCK